jgi:hypothetical protein
MSNIYMRQIMEAIEMGQNFNEGYEDRVHDVVAIITRDYPNGISKSAFPAAIEKAGKESGVTDMQSDYSREEFIKAVAGKMSFISGQSSQDKSARKERVMLALVDIINDEIDNAFPDGDPFDAIYPQARKLGVPANSVLNWLDKTAREHLNAKSFHDYLQEGWGQQMESNFPAGDHPNHKAFG